MSVRTVAWFPLLALFAGCAHPVEPQLAVAEPAAIVDVGDPDGASRRTGELRPEDERSNGAAKQETEQDAEDSSEAARKRAQDRMIAENAGILGALQNQPPMADVFGKSGLGAGSATGLGGLTGHSIGEAYGTGGLGLSGTGRGGGGTGEGIGLGSVGIVGRGGGGGSGYGSGTGRLGAGRSGPRPQVSSAKPQVVGRLDKSIIQRIIRRHLNQVRYCYERQLSKDPNLEGSLKIKFAIGPSGRVATVLVQKSVEASVDSCVARVFRRMTFPKPQGGGAVVVSYPLIFQPGTSTPAGSKKPASQLTKPPKAAKPPRKPAKPAHK